MNFQITHFLNTSLNHNINLAAVFLLNLAKGKQNLIKKNINLSIESLLFFYIRCGLITSTLCAYKFRYVR